MIVTVKNDVKPYFNFLAPYEVKDDREQTYMIPQYGVRYADGTFSAPNMHVLDKDAGYSEAIGAVNNMPGTRLAFRYVRLEAVFYDWAEYEYPGEPGTEPVVFP